MDFVSRQVRRSASYVTDHESMPILGVSANQIRWLRYENKNQLTLRSSGRNTFVSEDIQKRVAASASSTRCRLVVALVCVMKPDSIAASIKTCF